MKSIKNLAQSLWNDESAQGATEYILLLVVVVGIVLAFKKPIMSAVSDQLGKVNAGMAQVTTDSSN